MGQAIARSLGHAGVDTQLAWLLARGHFYSLDDISLADDGSKMSVLQRAVGFCHEKLGLRAL